MSVHARRINPRLLFVLNDAPFFVSHRLPIARAAIDLGFDVHLAAPSNPAADATIAAAGVTRHHLLLNRSSTNPIAEARTVSALMSLYRRLGPDILHHVTPKPVLYGSWAARATRMPAVVNAVSGLGYLFIARGWQAALWRPLVRQAYRIGFAHPNCRVILQNRDDYEAFVNRGLVDARNSVLIRGSGVDTAAFAPTPEPTGVPLVILPARVLRDKGVEEFMLAARYIKTRMDARFALVGGLDVNPSAIDERTVQQWVQEGVVEWWGHRADMHRVLSECTLVCLPSYREGLPKALLEAMAAQRAIVTTDAPGCREAVTHGLNGLLVPAREWRPLADALEQLLRDQTRRRQLAANGRARAVAEFDVHVVVEQTLAVYRQLLT